MFPATAASAAPPVRRGRKKASDESRRSCVLPGRAEPPSSALIEKSRKPGLALDADSPWKMDRVALILPSISKKTSLIPLKEASLLWPTEPGQIRQSYCFGARLSIGCRESDLPRPKSLASLARTLSGLRRRHCHMVMTCQPICVRCRAAQRSRHLFIRIFLVQNAMFVWGVLPLDSSDGRARNNR